MEIILITVLELTNDFCIFAICIMINMRYSKIANALIDFMNLNCRNFLQPHRNHRAKIVAHPNHVTRDKR